MSDISTATAVDFRTALDEFEAAWENPNHTRFTLPAVEVNTFSPGNTPRVRR